MGRTVRRGWFVRTLGLCAGLWLAAACGQTPGENRLADRADTVTVDRQRCILPEGMPVSHRAAARCAELFVQRNGYTDLPPVPDSTQWSYEFLDLGIEARRGRLERRAYAVCGNAQSDSVVLVLFRFSGPEFEAPPAMDERGKVTPPDRHGRAVQLRSDLSSMGLRHQDLLLPDSGSERCRLLT